MTGGRNVATMSAIMSRWLVRQEHPVTEHDLGRDGAVSDEAVERWVTAAHLAYLDHCTLVQQRQHEFRAELRHRMGTLPAGTLFGTPASVVVTASATEVRPKSFTIAVRIRPCGGDRDIAANANCVVHLEDRATGEARELGKDIRDELIALEHSARHFN